MNTPSAGAEKGARWSVYLIPRLGSLLPRRQRRRKPVPREENDGNSGRVKRIGDCGLPGVPRCWSAFPHAAVVQAYSRRFFRRRVAVRFFAVSPKIPPPALFPERESCHSSVPPSPAHPPRGHQEQVKELIGIKESDTGLSQPSQWDLVSDKQMMQEEQPLQVRPSPGRPNPGSRIF